MLAILDVRSFGTLPLQQAWQVSCADNDKTNPLPGRKQAGGEGLLLSGSSLRQNLPPDASSPWSGRGTSRLATRTGPCKTRCPHLRK